MQLESYLCIGGNHDSLDCPAHAATETIQIPVGVTGREKYIRETLSVGGASVTIYRHESLPPEEVLNRLVGHYKAWAVNMPGGRPSSNAGAATNTKAGE
jgi:hypothetical protein